MTLPIMINIRMRDLIDIVNEEFPEAEEPKPRPKRPKVPRGKYKPIANQPSKMGEVGRDLRKRYPKEL